MFTTNTLAFRSFKRGTRQSPRNVHITLNKSQSLHILDERYLSFSIDISVLAGGYWWEGAQNSSKGLGTVKVPPLDLSQKKLNKLVKALSPAYLRIGGSEADKLYYFDAPQEIVDPLILNQDMWDQVHDFCQRNALSLMFTFKYGV